MVERIKINPQEVDELQEILKHIENGDNFLLSGGAGSGKTYTLVQVIKKVIEKYPTSKVACMTYTNAAVKEIEERVNHKSLNVTTIHDFLWDNIKHFQKELKKSLIDLSNDTNVKRIKISDTEVPTDYFKNLKKGIQYKEYLRLTEGIISHDEILILANHMFKTYPKLSDILKDKFKFIFVDEYQDTSKLVVEIFLDHFKLSKKNNIIGFFGDAMQSIYDDGIGNLDNYKGNEEGKVKEVKKEQNRRNPKLIIDLANRLRTDDFAQTASDDSNAPNMDGDGNLKMGEVKFLYSYDNDIEKVKKHLGWDFGNSKKTKELNLTHNLIADKAGFKALMDVYDSDPVIALKSDILKKIKENKEKNRPEIEINETDTFESVVNKFQLKNRQRELKKDILLADSEKASLFNELKDKPFSEVRNIYLSKEALIDDKKQDEDDENKKGSKRDELIKHLFKIQLNISLYQNKKYNEFLRATDYRFQVTSIANKIALKEKIESLVNTDNKTIEEVINEANEKEICLIDDKLNSFIDKNDYLYNRIKDIKFSEFQNLFEYLEGKTPFSTQHKTKGAEFENVLVILDNGNWNKYNFQNLFLDSGNASVLERTRKIFYVCCTRAKEKLTIYYNSPSATVIDKAKDWFGEENIISL
ncbi:UvrD-helicase domain-containing protein [Aquimarina rhabdastrellae]